MTTLEPQSAVPKPGRPFQFSLRAMFGLTTGTAAFFALGRMLGYADAIVILAGIVITVGVMEWPRRVCLPTGIMLTLVAGTLLWANLRPNNLTNLVDRWPPGGLDPFAKAMFGRGWPIAPIQICEVYFKGYHPNVLGVYSLFSLHALVFAVALVLVRRSSELCFRKQDKQIVKPPPAGSTSEPRVE